MRVPLSWLSEFVQISDAPESLAARLTAAGVKVEKIHRPGQGVEGVVVGEIRDILPHPHAERLTLVEVGAGSADFKVVCGARNFAVGDRVPLALPGSRLPGLGEVQPRAFRGVTSVGMLCSPRELGLGDDHSGILVLGPDAEPGSDLVEVLGLPDVVFELEINPNRPDLMGIVGVAREVAAATGEELKDWAPSLDEGASPVDEYLKVEVLDSSGCPRYLARVIDGVGFGQSPAWAQHRLSMAGLRPISAVVDATNYALMVTAHPLHAFDLDLLEGGLIRVRRAEEGESMTMIDGADRTLDPEDLVIADASRPVALAGVMGGMDSGVGPSTTRVALESAYFDPVSIFRTGARHGVRTEASARFERGADPNVVRTAADLATSLILEWGGGKAAAGAIDVYPHPVSPVTVAMRPERARKLLGVDWPTSEMVDALDSLGLHPVMEDHLVHVEAPTYRVDLKGEEDLIEEVARYVGYEQIPSTLPARARSVGSLPAREQTLRRLKRVLVGAGLYEARTSSFIGPGDLDKLGARLSDAIAIANPLTQDDSLLRNSLLPGLLRSLVLNFARRTWDVRLFEIGKVFVRSPGGPFEEPARLAIVMGGTVPQEWHSGSRELDFFDLKGVVELVLDTLNIPAPSFMEHGSPPYHPTRSAQVRSGDVSLGVFGEAGPELAAKLDLPSRIYMGEFDLDALLFLASTSRVAGEQAKYPAVLLDIAMSVPEGVRAADVIDTARSVGGDHLENLRLIDVYRGGQVAEGNKSLAITLSFRSPERTLTEAEALLARDAIISAISERHGGRIRG
jgi:phenylalanyl-tRNA synthetase beta chain